MSSRADRREAAAEERRERSTWRARGLYAIDVRLGRWTMEATPASRAEAVRIAKHSARSLKHDYRVRDCRGRVVGTAHPDGTWTKGTAPRGRRNPGFLADVVRAAARALGLRRIRKAGAARGREAAAAVASGGFEPALATLRHEYQDVLYEVFGTTPTHEDRDEAWTAYLAGYELGKQPAAEKTPKKAPEAAKPAAPPKAPEAAKPAPPPTAAPARTAPKKTRRNPRRPRTTMKKTARRTRRPAAPHRRRIARRNPATFQQGDIVRHRAEFLRSISWYTDVPKDGLVVSVGESSGGVPAIVVVQWNDRDEGDFTRILATNIEHVPGARHRLLAGTARRLAKQLARSGRGNPRRGGSRRQPRHNGWLGDIWNTWRMRMLGRDDGEYIGRRNTLAGARLPTGPEVHQQFTLRARQQWGATGLLLPQQMEEAYRSYLLGYNAGLGETITEARRYGGGLRVAYADGARMNPEHQHVWKPVPLEAGWYTCSCGKDGKRALRTGQIVPARSHLRRQVDWPDDSDHTDPSERYLHDERAGRSCPACGGPAHRFHAECPRSLERDNPRRRPRPARRSRPARSHRRSR